MKILILCILLSFSSSCIFLPVAGVVVTTSTMAVKYKWHKNEVTRTEAFREAVLDGLTEINQTLEESTNEMQNHI